MQNKDINEVEMDSDTEIYLINKLEMEKLCRAKEPATISISDPRLQVGWVSFRSRGENDGNIEMVLAIYNKEKFQDLLTKQVEEAYTRGYADATNYVFGAVERAIVNEITTAHLEGQPTSRLTSLANSLTNLRKKQE